MDARWGFSVAVKCPKCGFVSYPGLEQCRKCGYRLTQARGRTREIPPLFHPSLTGPKTPARLDSEPMGNRMEMGRREAPGLDMALGPEGTFSGSIEPGEGRREAQPSQGRDFSAWQAELTERVQEYRQRRARLHKGEKSSPATLDFDFGSSASDLEETRPPIIEFPSAKEADRHAGFAPEVRLGPPPPGLEDFEPTPEQEDGEVVSPPARDRAASRAETGPLEIEFGSSPRDFSAGMGGDEPSGVPGASIGMRFFAGAIDFMVLLSGAGVYALIFWRVGGRFSFQPLELAVAALVGVFFILLYFGGCAALASATPGLLWAGLEVRTFEGDPPGPVDCLWRAFGYLVSMSALMLGFIWAAVDADGLTWHDRMSRTFIVPADRA